MGSGSERRTFVLVDGENIDATLGTTLLGRRPDREERPRWERVTDYARDAWGQGVTALFFLNASSGVLPGPFVQALLAIGYRPVPLSGKGEEKVVDAGIIRTLEALAAHPEADVLLCSHDADFVEALTALEDGTRRLGVVAFREYVSGRYAAAGVRIHDLEYDVKAFNVELPRVRIIPLEEFDPETFLR